MSDSAQKVWVTVEGKKYLVEIGDLNQRPLTVYVEGTRFEVDLDSEIERKTDDPTVNSDVSIQSTVSPDSIPAGTVCEVTSPMPGDIVQILVKAGQKVAPGDPLCILDAMKMKNTIHAPQAGIISEIGVKEGQSVDYGVVLFKFS
ncbi:MAG: biotin/lipoyl-binding protein [Anaerolineales bacterium]|nr:biotin/lipoyl-binding protein [Anaerolineales bacterium]